MILKYFFIQKNKNVLLPIKPHFESNDDIKMLKKNFVWLTIQFLY